MIYQSVIYQVIQKYGAKLWAYNSASQMIKIRKKICFILCDNKVQAFKIEYNKIIFSEIVK